MSAPITLTIATGGLEDLERFQHEVSEMVDMDLGSFIKQWTIFDLTTTVEDPSTIVCPECDFTDSFTVNVVMALDGFTAAIIQIVELVSDGWCFIFAHSLSGIHRGSVCGATLESNFNSFLSFNGSREYNCKWFPFHNVSGEYWRDRLSEMMTWVNSVGREEKGPRILSEVFGQAAQMRFEARNPFWELQYNLDKLFTRPWTMPIQRMNVVDGGEKIPEWATFEPSVKVWWKWLDHLGVDTPAKQLLFALAQLPDGGYVAANNLISKLIKKVNDTNELNNPSAFVFNGVQDARRQMGHSGVDT